MTERAIREKVRVNREWVIAIREYIRKNHVGKVQKAT